jgi:uncharacterized membrane protein
VIRPANDELTDWVSRVLATGTALAIGVVLVGMALTWLTGATGAAGAGGVAAGGAAQATSGGLLAQIAALKPASIVSLGLLLLVLTPVAVLTAALVAFIRSGEHRYVAITSLVLGLLVVGVLAASFVSQGIGG